MEDFYSYLEAHYKYFLALHIIFIVTWFAGLFYIMRLYIYHIEADSKPEPDKRILQTQYKVMEKRLMNIITWPSMILTLVLGSTLVCLNPNLLSQGYFILKLFFVSGVVLYHVQCHVILKQLQRGEIKTTSLKLRIMNEVATVLLFAIVFLIVLKTNTGWVWGTLALIIFSVTLMIAIKMYKKSRDKKEGLDKTPVTEIKEEQEQQK